ncbi:hypothetical protein F8M41_019474 [Gigaspora margarita]|uniref:Uncharacterized protein n=1 Tax=Gigaspora margarita TaxID=4874 RepID=A0A8H4EKH9_GIGMA|nr:hypothetical protein F8M41_019474 [Gigaspora margarita]
MESTSLSNNKWQSNHIKDELNFRGINYSNNASRLDLLNLLQKEIFFETTKELNKRKNYLPVNDIVLTYTTEQSFVPKWFLLDAAMFMAGQEDHSKQNSAKEIFDELLQMAEESMLSPEEVPSKQTIQSWIG